MADNEKRRLGSAFRVVCDEPVGCGAPRGAERSGGQGADASMYASESLCDLLHDGGVWRECASAAV